MSNEEVKCEACEFIDCFYKELGLSPEEVRKAMSLPPEESVKFLESIRSKEELRRALKKCLAR